MEKVHVFFSEQNQLYHIEYCKLVRKRNWSVQVVNKIKPCYKLTNDAYDQVQELQLTREKKNIFLELLFAQCKSFNYMLRSRILVRMPYI